MVDLELTERNNEFIVNNKAIIVENAYKQYGRKSNAVVILKNFSMTVQKGSIYGLLGPSGCGKTTILNSILGLTKLDTGNITILGEPPKTGTRIGFMPQQISLYKEFTIHETMKYFGWLTNMETKTINNRTSFLAKLLMLPKLNKKVDNLSGGEQRRVSLAAALLHEPELLILDEPTVGLDSVLREVIWDHLISIANAGITVILTTHYIDESRQAHMIGLMCNGKLIAENTPTNLLEICDSETLEQAFFKLSIAQDNESHCNYEDNPQDTLTVYISKTASRLCNNNIVLHKNHLKVLIWKNLIWIYKNPLFILTILGTPLLLSVLFCLSFGHFPTDLDIAVVNYETDNITCANITRNATYLSCHFLDYLQRDGLNLIPFESEEEARISVIARTSYASIVFSENYTSALKSRIHNTKRIKDWDFEYSTISIYTNFIMNDVTNHLKFIFMNGFKEFISDYWESCNETRKYATLPIQFNKPIYGGHSKDYTDFATPGILQMCIAFFAASLASNAISTEKKDGILERSLLIGITTSELVLSHIICEFVLLLIYCAIVIGILFGAFKLTIIGPLWVVVLLALMNGFLGMSFGFLVSSIFTDEYLIIFTILGAFLPGTILSGIFWPLEAMHHVIKPISYIIPFTQSVGALRSVLQRGWTLTEPTVYIGLITLSGWIIVFSIITMLFLKFKA